MATKYEIAKENARQQAQDWQLDQASKSMSYGELAAWQNHFYKLGKRYGLLKEFRENAII